ncbi:MAG: methylamine dehydrogenase [Gammaproteobacteria bacterium]|jgi:methylamine dehydrogenase accessory protein MauD|nr:methylamine dehydrogenase [Gammaproteobacteria bacterium]
MDNLLAISNVALWIVMLGLGLLVFALSRQLGVLYDRVAPAGALMVNQLLAVGDPAPVITAPALDGTMVSIGGERGRSHLLFFLAPDCPICKSLVPVLRSIGKAEPWLDISLASDGGTIDEHELFVRQERLTDFEYLISEDLGRAYGISKLPYAVLIDEIGLIAAMGIVNSREHLESLFEAKERNIGSIQEYLQDQDSPVP